MYISRTRTSLINGQAKAIKDIMSRTRRSLFTARHRHQPAMTRAVAGGEPLGIVLFLREREGERGIDILLGNGMMDWAELLYAFKSSFHLFLRQRKKDEKEEKGKERGALNGGTNGRSGKARG